MCISGKALDRRMAVEKPGAGAANLQCTVPTCIQMSHVVARCVQKVLRTYRIRFSVDGRLGWCMIGERRRKLVVLVYYAKKRNRWAPGLVSVRNKEGSLAWLHQIGRQSQPSTGPNVVLVILLAQIQYNTVEQERQKPSDMPAL